MTKTESVIEPVDEEKFDCVEMKRKAQARIYEETKDMTLDEMFEYWQRKYEEFRELAAERDG